MRTQVTKKGKHRQQNKNKQRRNNWRSNHIRKDMKRWSMCFCSPARDTCSALRVSQMSTSPNSSTLDLCANAPTAKSMTEASMADSSWFSGAHAPSRVTVLPSSPAHLIGGEVSLMDSLSTDNFSAVSSSLIWKRLWRTRRPSTCRLLSLPFLLNYSRRRGEVAAGGWKQNERKQLMRRHMEG